MKLFFTLIFIFGSTQYLDNNVTRRVISDDEYNYTFYISDKDTSDLKDYKEYHWYRNGKVHASYGGANGQLLHGEYIKAYKTNDIAEQGVFDFGLKVKPWKTWYRNGKLKKIVNWSNGLISGNYKEFSEKGELLVVGRYKGNRKHGRWIDYKTKDTLYFKKGEKVVKEEVEGELENEDKKSFGTKIKGFFKDLFKKKTPEEKEKAKQEREQKKKQKELEAKRKELARKKMEAKAGTTQKNSSKQGKEQKQKQKELEKKRKELAKKKKEANKAGALKKTPDNQ